MKSPHLHSSMLCFVLILAACNGGSELPSPPVLPSAPAPLPAAQSATWRADATVLAATNPGRACGWGTSAGETRSGVAWGVTITGDSIRLDEDMANWPTDHIPFSGNLSGRQFTASYTNGENYLQYACQFKGGTLTGTFSPDFSSFEAFETLVWGPPEGETTVRRRWVGSRL
jgi:hypothetical protein